MLFIPKYTVSYKGIFRAAGKPFEIDPKDENELSEHGRVVKDNKKSKENSETVIAEKTVKKAGRPKKTNPKEVTGNGHSEAAEIEN